MFFVVTLRTLGSNKLPMYNMIIWIVEFSSRGTKLERYTKKIIESENWCTSGAHYIQLIY